MKAPQERTCQVCGQRIPTTAKLTGATADGAGAEVCLRCRILMAEAKKRS